MTMAFTFGMTGGYVGKVAHATSAVDYALTQTEKDHKIVCVTLSASSKTVTAGVGDDEYLIVVNEGGTNAFTLKNVAGDTGTSIATSKAVLLIGSKTADKSIVIALN